jgi:hypothetical protein
MIVSTRGYTADLPIPGVFLFAIGNGADVVMHGGKLRGGLMITAKEAEPDIYRCRWTCPGSQYDGRDFLLTPGAISEVGGLGQTPIFNAPYRLAVSAVTEDQFTVSGLAVTHVPSGARLGWANNTDDDFQWLSRGRLDEFDEYEVHETAVRLLMRARFGDRKAGAN